MDAQVLELCGCLEHPRKHTEVPEKAVRVLCDEDPPQGVANICRSDTIEYGVC